MGYGIWGLVPPILAIVLALWTREVIVALFVGTLAGALILSGGNPVVAVTSTISDHIIANTLADSWNIGVILFCLLIGGLVGIIGKIGGTAAVAKRVVKRAKSSQTSLFWAAILGIMLFIDDYANSMLVGNTMRPITDKYRVSREKLAYICDSTAAPVSSMAPLSTWIAAELIVIAAALRMQGITANPFVVFFQSIPFRFYSIFSLALVFIIILLRRDYGPMYTAERRARETGAVYAVNHKPMHTHDKDLLPDEGVVGSVWGMILPVGVFILVTVLGLFSNGSEALAKTIAAHRETIALAASQAGSVSADALLEAKNVMIVWDGMSALQRYFYAIGSADASVVLNWASVLSIITAMGCGLRRKVAFDRLLEAFVGGLKSMVLAVTVLALALALKNVISEMGLAIWIAEQAQGMLLPQILPVLVFLSAMGISFATGTAWGTNAILMPIVIPVAASVGSSGNELTTILIASIGAVLTGAVFGDHCSPISDTSILSSSGSGSDHLAHVKTQVPYAITCAMVSFVSFGLAGLGVPSWILIPVGIVILVAVVLVLGKDPEAGLSRAVEAQPSTES